MPLSFNLATLLPRRSVFVFNSNFPTDRDFFFLKKFEILKEVKIFFKKESFSLLNKTLIVDGLGYWGIQSHSVHQASAAKRQCKIRYVPSLWAFKPIYSHSTGP